MERPCSKCHRGTQAEDVTGTKFIRHTDDAQTCSEIDQMCYNI
jgi:hypothetical protein